MLSPISSTATARWRSATRYFSSCPVRWSSHAPPIGPSTDSTTVRPSVRMRSAGRSSSAGWCAGAGPRRCPVAAGAPRGRLAVARWSPPPPTWRSGRRACRRPRGSPAARFAAERELGQAGGLEHRLGPRHPSSAQHVSPACARPIASISRVAAGCGRRPSAAIEHEQAVRERAERLCSSDDPDRAVARSWR